MRVSMAMTRACFHGGDVRSVCLQIGAPLILIDTSRADTRYPATTDPPVIGTAHVSTSF